MAETITAAMRDRTTLTVGPLVVEAFAEDVTRFPELPVTLATHDAVEQHDDDIRHVHLAVDRLRAHLANFAPALDASWRDSLAGELGWLASAVAPAHDLEILHNILAACAATLPLADAARLDELFGALAGQHVDARVNALAALADERAATLHARLAQAAADPPVVADSWAAQWVDDTLPVVWERLTREVDRLGDTPERVPEGAHEATRRMRLAVLSATPLLGEPADRLASALKSLQRVLGAHRGAAIAVAWVRSETLAHDTDQFAAGMASGLLHHAVHRAGTELPAAWAKVKRRKDALWS
jgi:CHAD domain-containing protein